VHFYLPFYYSFILIVITLHTILFPHLLSTKHKCNRPYYFPLLYKPTGQKVKMNMKNSLTNSSRLCADPVVVPVSLPLFHFVRESS
jgi:hypothetical protein